MQALWHTDLHQVLLANACGCYMGILMADHIALGKPTFDDPALCFHVTQLRRRSPYASWQGADTERKCNTLSLFQEMALHVMIYLVDRAQAIVPLLDNVFWLR